MTDDAVAARPDFVKAAREVLEAGASRVVLHLRSPGASGRRMFALAAELVPASRAAGARLLVNDRVDVALAAGADGVQLGRRSLCPADARRLLGPDAWIGASVRGGEEGAACVGGGADFLVVGTIYATPSHPGRAGAGPGRIREMVGLGVPLVAIGGVTVDRVDEVRRAGAAGVAVIRGVWGAARPGTAIEEYLRAWRDWRR